MKKIYDVMPENKLQTSDSSVGRTWPFVARDSLQSNSFSNLALNNHNKYSVVGSEN
jgi:hypothetical protein